MRAGNLEMRCGTAKRGALPERLVSAGGHDGSRSASLAWLRVLLSDPESEGTATAMLVARVPALHDRGLVGVEVSNSACHQNGWNRDKQERFVVPCLHTEWSSFVM
jgi:hypothetical protein